jgi:hypothetical protein
MKSRPQAAPQMVLPQPLCQLRTIACGPASEQEAMKSWKAAPPAAASAAKANATSHRYAPIKTAPNCAGSP